MTANATANAYADRFIEQPLGPDEGGGSDMPPTTARTVEGEIGQPLGAFAEPSIGPDYGRPYDPSADEPDIRLNMTATDLGRFLDEQQGRINTARRSLELAYGDAVNAGYDLDSAAEWDRLRSERPETYDRISANIEAANKAARIVDMNATAADRETSAAPLRLDETDAQRAATLLPLMQAEVSTLPLPELRDALRFAISTDDRAAQYVYARLLPGRLERGAGQTADGTVRRSDGDKRVIGEIRDMLTTVRANLKDTSLSSLNDRARAVRSSALALKREAGKRRRATSVAPFDRAYEAATGRAVIRVR